MIKLEIKYDDKIIAYKFVDDSDFISNSFNNAFTNIINLCEKHFELDVSKYRLDEFVILGDFVFINMRLEDFIEFRNNKIKKILENKI
jgi:hypothetical protein